MLVTQSEGEMSETADKIWNQRILDQEAWLRTVVRSRLSAPADVDDVMQSVMSDAIAAGYRQSEVNALGPWLYRLAVNAVLQFRRKCGRRRKLHDRYSSLVATEDSIEPLQLLVGIEQQVIVQSALNGLPGEDVEILLLKYVHGWNYTRISQQLGLEGYRVAHRLRRARERLKHQLQQRGLGTDEA